LNTALDNLAVGTMPAGVELAYIIGLLVSGILLVTLGAIGVGGMSGGMRALNVVIGLAFLGYAGYIFFFTGEGDTIIVFYYVFIAPIALLIRSLRGNRATT
jgi:hypothetical protein